jgi:hypothetical protein
MVAVEITGEFSSDDYARGYVCVAPNRTCSPHLTVSADGVWFRESSGGLQQSAHRGCLSITNAG